MNKRRKQKALFVILVFIFVAINYGIIGYGRYLTYDYDTHNCTHMSHGLEDFIESVGIPVTIVTGVREDETRHMWIKITGVELDSVFLLPFINGNYSEHRIEYVSFGEYEECEGR